MYGKAFIPLFIIALIPQIPTVLSLALGQSMGEVGDLPAADGPQFSATVDIFLPLLAFLLSIPSAAAAVFCVGQALTGRKVDVVTGYSRAFGVLLPAAAVTVIVTLALAGSAVLMLIIVGVPLFFYLLVIWFFAMPAVVIEGMGGIDALKRSRQLTKGSWWRLFGIGIVFTLLTLAVWIPGGIVSAYPPVHQRQAVRHRRGSGHRPGNPRLLRRQRAGLRRPAGAKGRVHTPGAVGRRSAPPGAGAAMKVATWAEGVAIAGGLAILVGYWMVLVLSALFGTDEVPVLVKVAVPAVMSGAAVRIGA